MGQSRTFVELKSEAAYISVKERIPKITNLNLQLQMSPLQLDGFKRNKAKLLHQTV